LYSYSLKETLNITQHLREKYKAITYNRVATRYLPENLHEEAPTTLNTPIKYFYNGKIEGLNFKQKSAAFDSSKIVDHHGIIPAGKPDISQFNEKELNVYKLIVDYYIYQFLPPSIYIKRTLSGEVKGYKFSSTKSNLISKGYLVITKPDEEQANINSYKNDKGKEDFFKFPKGKSIIEDGEIIERETSPPKRYTEESLLLDMTRISKFVEDKELKNALLSKDKEKPDENGSIGTPATRHTILDTLLDPRRGYVEKQGKNLISTQKGRDFIKFVPKEISSPTLTAKWWLIQEQITEGKTKKETLIENVRDMTFAIVEKEKKNLKIVPLKAEGEKKMNELICKCPFCGKNVYEKEKVFACENSGKDINGKPKPCSFVWYKNNKWWNSKGIKVDKKLIKIFAEEGLTQTFKTLKSPKTGKTYTGVITVSKALPSSPWQTVKLDMEFL
jgi:DNA topoisomerase-3